MKKIVALFDCDGTLYSSKYGGGLIKYANKYGRKNMVRAYYAANLFPYLLRKVKFINEESYHRPLAARLAWMINGLDAEQCQSVSEWIFSNCTFPTERTDVIARLREHQSKGHIVALVSGILAPALDLIGKKYNVNGIVGTQVEMRDGRYTGRIVPPVITGMDKDRHTREFFSSQNLEIDWDASYAYADSITDICLFDMVGHPVAVHPDAKLFALAQRKNWEMIGASRART